MDIRLSLQGDAAAAIITPFVLLLLGWIVAIVGRVRIARRHAEAWGRMVDKLTPDAVGRLVGDGRGEVLEYLLAGPDRPHTRIIAAAQSGVVVLTLGLTLIGASVAQTGMPLIVGLLVAAAGVGLLGAAVAGYGLSAHWGLLDSPRRDVHP
ncbi:MAG TPA: hypothetical protein VG871_05285 [Vicinamibacterales bacterium]|jgi:hypothetical protein|nr:hypothetical protein [Vicinamibacterales bacterium]